MNHKMNNVKSTEVIFVGDDDIEDVIDCFNQPIENKRKNVKEGPNRKPSTPATPATFLTKSGRKVVSRFKKITITDVSDDEKSDLSDVEPLEGEKPSCLYDDDNSLGKELFGFQTPKSRQNMLDKASESILNPKTPHEARKTIKKGIAKELTRQQFERLLENSESEYEPTTSESDDTDSDLEVHPLDSPSESPELKPRKEINHNFLFTSDEYFERKNTKSFTSNHTLSRLKNPKIHQEELTKLIKNSHPKHEKALRDLRAFNRSMYKRWLFSMSEGFNILLYGVGSKKKLLEDFRSEFLSDCHSVVVNGFFPGLTAKTILETIAGNLNIKDVPSLPQEILKVIHEKQKNNSKRIFVIINGIEAGLLKCEKSQIALAQLASLPNVHLLASIDHINAPLVWDQKKLSEYNFIWEDATTFEPYLEETSYESSLMVQRSGAIALSALKNVYESLTRNTRQVFAKLLDHQLKHGKQYSGMAFSELYRQCRDGFIVSSDLALRTQLTEFIDHEIVKWKKDTDHLIIPIENSILKQFQEEVIEEI